MADTSTGVLVAVSGGPDSVALLDMLLRLAQPVGGWTAGVGDEKETGSSPNNPNPELTGATFRLHIAHLNHMLRGRESAEDAEFVQALAARLELQVTIGSVDVRAAAEAAGRGIEETARHQRYNFLLSVAREMGCDRIAVGHTMTDQAETFVMRLMRGAGARGLSAMRPVSPVPLDDAFGGEKPADWPMPVPDSLLSSPFCLSPPPLLIRPLLCVTRQEIEDYCRQRNLEFRTDATNQDLHYTRNRIRSEIFPPMSAINPRVVESIARAAENLASDQDALDSLSSSLLSAARIERLHDRPCEHGSEAYSIAAFLKQPTGMRRRMIIQAVRIARRELNVGTGSCEVSSLHIRAVEGLLTSGASGKRIVLPGVLEAWREFDALVLKHSGIESTDYRIAITGSDDNVRVAGFDFVLQRDRPGELFNAVVQTAQREKERTGLDWMEVALADFVLPDSLIIRPRQSGERSHVVGQRRTIKLKNLMIDHRIPSSRRVDWPFVTTPDGRYVWSPGLPPAVEFAATDERQRLAIFRASAT